MKKLVAFLAVLTLATPAAWGDSGPTAPLLIGADKISAGDTAWMLTSTALVLMMSIRALR
jgi:Amt family ammonium transporter